MANSKSNYPPATLDRLNGSEFTGETVNSIMELSARGRPRTVEELQERLQQYFDFCADHKFRPGIETLSLSLGVTRQAFWTWCSKDGCKDQEWREACQQARQIVLSFLEQAALCGHLSPPTAIFLFKNIGGYKDVLSFDEQPIKQENEHGTMTLPDLSMYVTRQQD